MNVLSLVKILDFDRLVKYAINDITKFDFCQYFPLSLKIKRIPKTNIVLNLKKLNDLKNITGNLEKVNDYFISQNSIFKICVIGNLLKEIKSIYLELLVCSVYNENNYIGIILPLQDEVIIINIENWRNSDNFKLFVNEIMRLTTNYPKKLITNENVQYCDFSSHAGIHGVINDKPFQISLKLFEDKYHLLKDKIWYTHSPFTINLASSKNYVTSILINELNITKKLFGKGVVVHTGVESDTVKQECIISNTTALEIMYNNVKKCLNYASESCPLLIETPAAEKNEMCCNIFELIDFFNKFTIDEKKVLGVCIDTCHVFSAGYNPIIYLNEWIKYSDIPIKLVHFNDCTREFGCRHDEHSIPGHGHIGTNIMKEVFEFCIQRKIDMVMEVKL